MLEWRPRDRTHRVILHDAHALVPDAYDYLLAKGRSKGLLAVGYHFVIETNGAVKSGRPLEAVGSHTHGHNEDSVGVCLALPFSEAQRLALAGLVHRLQVLYAIPLSIVGHKEVHRTRSPDCPPLDMKDLRQFIRKEIARIMTTTTPPGVPAPNELSTQQALIVSYLQKGHTLTTQIAMVSLGIQSLSSRVAELRKLGYEIEADPAKDYHGRSYLKYRLVQPSAAA